MGADKPNSEDYEPLLPTEAPQVQEENASGQTTDGARKWEGGLLQCCGACDLTGWGSCLLGYYVPCVVFGQNAKRALRQSAWLHGLLFLSFFVFSMWLATSVSIGATHNMLATCNGPPPPPHHPPHPLPGDGPDELMPRPEAEPLMGPLGRGLWNKMFGDDDDDDDHHHHHHDMWHHKHDEEDDDNDDEGSDKHHHEKHEADGNDGDHEHEGKAKKGKKCKKDKKAPKGPELPLDPAAADAFRDLGTFDIRKAGPHPEGPHPGPHHHGRHECQKAVGLWGVAMMLFIATPLLAVRYAAKRRTMLRKQFGIAGSKMGDFCTWFWCGPCALCQETRTLWVNNVHEGYWHGPTKLGAAPTVPSSAPAPQFMTTGAQTCQP